MKTVLFSFAFVAGLFVAVNAGAQEAAKTQESTAKVQPPVQTRSFIDANNDGVCDNWSTRPANGRGRNFVDANNDGVCDRYSQGNRNGGGRGQGFCRGNRPGRGQGFRHGRGWQRNQPAPVQAPLKNEKEK